MNHPHAHPHILQMAFKGSVSYLNNNINYVKISDGLEAKIFREDNALATVTFVNANDVAVNIPPNVQLVFQANNAPALRLGNSFIITWAEDYTMLRGQEELFRLDHQKQQAIGGHRDLETRIVQA